jgi:leucyl aminopeptidase
MTFLYSTRIEPNTDVIIPCKKGQVDDILKRLNLISANFEGEFGTYFTHYKEDGSKVYVLGIGEDKHASQIENAFRTLTYETKKYWGSSITIDVNSLSAAEVVKATIGVKLAEYQIGLYKSKPEEEKEIDVQFFSAKDIRALIHEGYETGATVNRIKALVDAPANIKTPEYLGKWAEQSAEVNNYTCKILHEKEL